jgi:hypothetical protein
MAFDGGRLTPVVRCSTLHARIPCPIASLASFDIRPLSSVFYRSASERDIAALRLCAAAWRSDHIRFYLAFEFLRKVSHTARPVPPAALSSQPPTNSAHLGSGICAIQGPVPKRR